MEVIKGDLFSITEGLIVHGVNCQGVMSSGVALQVKERYPVAYEEYCEYLRHNGQISSQQSLLLGNVQYSYVSPTLVIANAYTQKYYGKHGKYASYDAVDDAMGNISKTVEKECPIAMPQIGCGRGGLDWSVVKEIIWVHLKNHNLKVFWQ